MAKYEVKEELQLMEVSYDDGAKAVRFTFLDEDEGMVYEVRFNRQSYDENTRKFVDDEEKAKKVDEWCEQEFGVKYDELPEVVGVRKTVYVYDNFNSLWESEYAQKFDKEQAGELFEATITEIEDADYQIRIKYDIEGTIYQSNMTHGKYAESLKKWFRDPQKEKKQREKFLQKFGVPVEKGADLVGKKIMVEVKLAFGETPYGDIKKPSWVKAKK